MLGCVWLNGVTFVLAGQDLNTERHENMNFLFSA